MITRYILERLFDKKNFCGHNINIISMMAAAKNKLKQQPREVLLQSVNDAPKFLRNSQSHVFSKIWTALYLQPGKMAAAEILVDSDCFLLTSFYFTNQFTV